jgi:hypothetical protein
MSRKSISILFSRCRSGLKWPSSAGVPPSDPEVLTNKVAGPDGIPPIILKNCATAFALPLCLIFNNSISTFVFPDKWKLSYVTPIFKAGSRNDVTNYRGIAIFSAIAKLFELLIYKNMYKDLQRLISEGYVKG